MPPRPCLFDDLSAHGAAPNKSSCTVTYQSKLLRTCASLVRCAPSACLHRTPLAARASRRAQPCAAMASAPPAPPGTADLTAARLPALLAAVDTFLFDCDGVLWRGGVGIPGVGRVVTALQALGKRCYFVTNNSTKARAAYVEVLQRVAGIAAPASAILSSAFAAAEYLRAAGVTGKVYVIGEAGLVRELQEVAGVQCLGMEDAGKGFSFGATRPEDLDKDVKAVVCVGAPAHGRPLALFSSTL
jgi:hypothetical protein